MGSDVRTRARRKAKQVTETVTDPAVRERVTEGLRDLGDKVTGGAKEVGSRVGDTARKASVTMAPRVRRARKTLGYRIAGERPPTRTRRALRGGLAALGGAAAAFFLDPVSGKRRRHVARDKMASLARGVAGRASRTGRYVASTASGKLQGLRSGGERLPESDQVLSHKVESEVFQSDDIPKGQVSVNAEHGVVVLRGEVKSPDMISELERRVRAVHGVRDVRNLLHVPGTPAPTTTR